MIVNILLTASVVLAAFGVIFVGLTIVGLARALRAKEPRRSVAELETLVSNHSKEMRAIRTRLDMLELIERDRGKGSGYRRMPPP